MLASLPFADSVEAMRWSPNGAFIAMGGCINYDKSIHEIVVVSVKLRRIVARIRVPADATHAFNWTVDNRLWMESGDGWNVYASPFKNKVHVSAKLPQRALAKVKGGNGLDESVVVKDAVRQTVLLSFQDEVMQQEGNRYWFDTKRHIEVWRNGRVIHKTQFKPQEEGSSRKLNFTFNPDASDIAITVTGWIGHEAEGAGEIWLLDIKTGRLTLLHRGQVGAGLWDYPVQNVEPSWSKDGKTIVFGDREFGVEKINVVTGRHKQILPTGWGGSKAAISPDGAWIGFHYSGDKDSKDRVSIASRDGKTWGCVPEKFTAFSIDNLSWHPTQNVLAWASLPSNYNPCCGKSSQNTYSLYTWRIK
ncbi:MAG TPA: hypothetical protein VF600_11340 [Abditibacteriaceae bacterium]